MITMKTFVLGAMSLAMLGLSTAPALANPFEDRLQVKVGVIGVLPNEEADITIIGGDTEISDEYLPSVQLEWFFTDNVSAELLCCVAPHEVKAVGTALGTVNLGEITLFPPTLTVKYRANADGAVQPYVGAGINYTLFFNEDLPAGGPVTRIDYGSSIGPALQVGADFKINDRWSFNLDARRVWIHTDVTIFAGSTRIDADVNIDPWVIGAGFGYRF